MMMVKVHWIGCLFLLFSLPVSAQTCTEVDLADIPLETLAPSPAPANVVFLLDDSTSMDAEVLPAGDGPVSSIRAYLFDNAGDNASSIGEDYYHADERKYWRYQWHGFNRLYYNPAATYNPWPDPDNPDQTMGPADEDRPNSNPLLSGYTQDLDDTFISLSGRQVEVDDRSPVDANDSGFVSLTGVWGSNATEHFTDDPGATFTWNVVLPQPGHWTVWVANVPGNLDDQAVYDVTHADGASQVTIDQNAAQLMKLGNYNFDTAASVTVTRQNSDASVVTNADRVLFSPVGETIPVAHYYLQTAGGTPYLITMSGGLRYFRIDDQGEGQTGHGIVEDGELVEVVSLPGEIDPGLSYADDRQNFANWYSFHRKRSLAAISAVANAIVGLEDMQVGFYTLNGSLVQSVLPVQVENGQGVVHDQTGAVLRALYQYATGIKPGFDTLLRAGLDCVGRYYSTDLTCSSLGGSPMATVAEGGACQKQFVVIVTDGAYNGPTPSGIGNQDNGEGAPYEDQYADTLADVAMKYYKDEGDLSPDHEDIQRMYTFAIGFGVEGSLGRDRYPDAWPEPENDAAKIDDLWHATVNGRGNYYQPDSPGELTEGLEAIKEALLAFSGSSASVSTTGEAVEADNKVFVPSYTSGIWAGDLKAYVLSDGGSASVDWSASEQLESRTAASRKIFTFNGAAGEEFLPASLSNPQKLMISEAELNYIRGDRTHEQQNGGLFRTRSNLLGDIVHSAPTHHNDTVYVGANDGMLHAFSVSTGNELFAYVPYLPFQPGSDDSAASPLSMFDKLSGLTDVNYGEAHRFFVDGTPTVGAVGDSDYLVGGLGAGGKGYFCLDVTNPSGFDRSDVRWEFPNANTLPDHIRDVGFSFSRAMIVNTAAGTKVLFGNGYNSENGHAILFVLNLETGAVDAKIDTGAGSSDCNGLSTPIVIDVDNDDIADYAYAGDLHGNLWRFDLIGSTVASWKAEHLFQAIGPMGDEQPITTQPDAMFHCGGANKGIFLTFGTGKYLGASDLDPDPDSTNDDYQTQTLYGIWDVSGKWNGGNDKSAHDWGSFDRSCSQNTFCRSETATNCTLNPFSGVIYSLLKQQRLETVAENGSTFRIVSNNSVCWNGIDSGGITLAHGGWFLDLPEAGERVIADTAIRDFRVIAVSMQPSVEPCSSGGISFLHLLNACSGGRDPLPQIDVRNSGGTERIDSQDTVTSASGTPAAPSAIQVSGVAPQPLVLRNPNPDGAQTERLVFPQTFTNGHNGVGSDNSDVVTVRPEHRGTYYWREVR